MSGLLLKKLPDISHSTVSWVLIIVTTWLLDLSSWLNKGKDTEEIRPPKAKAAVAMRKSQAN